MSKIFMGGKL